jgi:hypothetical protein
MHLNPPLPSHHLSSTVWPIITQFKPLLLGIFSISKSHPNSPASHKQNRNVWPILTHLTKTKHISITPSKSDQTSSGIITPFLPGPVGPYRVSYWLSLTITSSPFLNFLCTMSTAASSSLCIAKAATVRGATTVVASGLNPSSSPSQYKPRLIRNTPVYAAPAAVSVVSAQYCPFVLYIPFMFLFNMLGMFLLLCSF